MSSVWPPGSRQVGGLYLITTRPDSLRQWRLIWRGSLGLSLPNLVPNIITPLFRYPAVFYNIAIFQCQGRPFEKFLLNFLLDSGCRGHLFRAFTITLPSLWKPCLAVFFFFKLRFFFFYFETEKKEYWRIIPFLIKSSVSNKIIC